MVKALPGLPKEETCTNAGGAQAGIPHPALFNNQRVPFPRSPATGRGGRDGRTRGERARRRRRRGKEGVCALGFPQPAQQKETLAVRPVLLPEGSQSWRVKSLQRA